MNRVLAWLVLLQPQLDLSSANETNGITNLKKLQEHPNYKLLNSETCGLSYSDRIIGGVNASIGAYPWIARIGYSSRRYRPRNKDPLFRCGGTIINEYYVLTAAHCILNIERNIIVSRVRLGDHNSETNPDCQDTFCNDPYEDFDIDKIIIHSEYDKALRNDIALIKVNRKIKFSDFIRPICMMKGKLLNKELVGETVEVAGWGIYDINIPAMSTILQTIKLPVQDTMRCTASYKKSKAPMTKKQLCVGGKVGEDSCGGDSGGPLMKVDVEDTYFGPRYYLFGITSYGAKLCGETDLPGVYTKVSAYMEWILDHIEP